MPEPYKANATRQTPEIDFTSPRSGLCIHGIYEIDDVVNEPGGESKSFLAPAVQWLQEYAAELVGQPDARIDLEVDIERLLSAPKSRLRDLVGALYNAAKQGIVVKIVWQQYDQPDVTQIIGWAKRYIGKKHDECRENGQSIAPIEIISRPSSAD